MEAFNPDNLSKYLQHKRFALGADVETFTRLIGMKESEAAYEKILNWERGVGEPTPRVMSFINSLPEFDSSPSIAAKFRFIDLFAGIGGIRIPFEEIGGQCVFTSEWDKFAQRTYAFNFGEVPSGDITEIRSKDVPSHDLLLAGFPCQAFSQAGLKRGFADTRGTLFFEVQRILAYHKPKAFLLENVKQLKGHDKGRTLQTILDVLRGKNSPHLPEDADLSEEARESLGSLLDYDVDFRVLSSNNFGVPQRRERIYILGFRRDFIGKSEYGLPIRILDRLSERDANTRLGDILEDSNSVDLKYTLSDRLWEGHQRRLIEHRAKGNGFGYSLFNEDSPYCSTISARYYKDGSEILVDQSHLNRNPRKLTPRECARIQGFPADFNLSAVSDPQLYKQFGNSVSVPVIRAIANEMAEVLGDGVC